MKITVNDEAVEIPEDTSVASLLATLEPATRVSRWPSTGRCCHGRSGSMRCPTARRSKW